MLPSIQGPFAGDSVIANKNTTYTDPTACYVIPVAVIRKLFILHIVECEQDRQMENHMAGLRGMTHEQTQAYLRSL